MNFRVVLILLAMCSLTIAHAATAGDDPTGKPTVALETSKGTILIELYPDKAPATVTNFLAYVDKGFYDGTIFHRVIPNFMIQGGGFTSGMKRKATEGPISNEADNNLKNDRGTIAMARTQDPHSATAQFFINTVDNELLNHKGKSVQTWGYAVFGKVVQGMDVVDAISRTKTGQSGGMRDVPVETISIVKAARKP